MVSNASGEDVKVDLGATETTSAPTDDRSTRARIRDAAVARFAHEGFGTGLRKIAADAGVSPGLVLHHFGSKEGLRAACDAHVVELVARRKAAVMAAGPAPDLLGAFREAADGLPLVRYLSRALVEGSSHAAALVDGLVRDAAAYMAQGVGSGAVRPSAHHDARAAVLTIWTLGALVLNEHVQRLLDVDLTEELPEQPGARTYLAAVGEIFAEGVLTDEMAATFRRMLLEIGGGAGDKAGE